MGRAGIIGYGEIGSSLASLYRQRQMPEPRIHDPSLGYVSGMDDCDVVHVCVPASAVAQVVRTGLKALWIVHSTVPVGTCRPLAATVHGRLVHAPVRGIHPNLSRGMQTFAMPVGGHVDAVKAALPFLTSLGIDARAWGTWEETELAKLLCTLRYGVDILYMRHVHELCEKFGADFERVYTEWTKQYGDGYEVLGQWWFHRPVLKPMPGRLGGHCVVPNARLLEPHSRWAKNVAHDGEIDWQPKAPSPKSAEGDKRMA